MDSFGIFSYTRGTLERDVPSRTALGTSLKPTKKYKHLYFQGLRLFLTFILQSKRMHVYFEKVKKINVNE